MKAPWHLWLVGILALLFNAIGAFDFVMSMARGEAYMTEAGMTADQVAHYRDMPIWAKAAWAVGALGAFIGAILLLLRRTLALSTFAIALAAFLLLQLYNYVLSDSGARVAEPVTAITVIIAAQLAFLCWYSWLMTAQRVLR